MERIIVDCWKDDIAEIISKVERNKEDCLVRMAHITSVIDDEECIKQEGLLELNALLNNFDSPIYRFLKLYGITIDINHKNIKYCDRLIPIERNISNSYLWEELYYKKTARESFVYTKSDIKTFDYSCIKKYPEILSKLDKYLDNKGCECNSLSHAWAKICTPIIYSFSVPIKQLRLNDGTELCADEFLENVKSEKCSNVVNNGFLAYGICHDFVIDYADMTKI